MTCWAASSGESASMKALPKRKGNGFRPGDKLYLVGLNESPSQKEGKATGVLQRGHGNGCLNESPSQKEGKVFGFYRNFHGKSASMKIPTKKQGNCRGAPFGRIHL